MKPPGQQEKECDRTRSSPERVPDRVEGKARIETYRVFSQRNPKVRFIGLKAKKMGCVTKKGPSFEGPVK